MTDASEAGENISFMKNLGGLAGCAGEWTICGGNSQTYADATVGHEYAPDKSYSKKHTFGR